MKKVEGKRGNGRLIGLAFGVFLCAMVLAGRSAGGGDVPVDWQPENFSGAEGEHFVVTMRASPTTVRVQEPLTLTVRVTATKPWQQPPRRIRLDRMKEFQDFIIEPSASEKPDRDLPADQAWEFDYRLRPKSEAVKKIPMLPFTYYNPTIPFENKRWPRTYADAIPLTVQPAARVNPEDVQGAGPAKSNPERLYHLTEGLAVLRREEGPGLPSGPVLAALLLVPPALCTGWYLAWRNRYPDAARLARQQRSRAARQALRALAGSRKEENGEQVRRAAVVLAAYLRQRTDLRAAEPTPAEVAANLERTGYSPDLAGKAAEFFRACDAARFSPASLAGQEELVAEGVRLIHALESKDEG